MHSPLSMLSDVFVFGFFVLPFVGIGIASTGKTGFYDLIAASNSDIVILRKKRNRTMGMAVASLGFVSIVLSFVLDSFEIPSKMPFVQVVFAALVASLIVAILLRVGQPDELRFDLASRTYERAAGWGKPVMTEPKSMAFLHGVYVGYSKGYHVGLAGESLQPMHLPLGGFSASAAAESYADEIRDVLRLSHTVPPKWMRKPPQVPTALS